MAWAHWVDLGLGLKTKKKKVKGKGKESNRLGRGGPEGLLSFSEKEIKKGKIEKKGNWASFYLMGCKISKKGKRKRKGKEERKERKGK